MMSGIDSMGEYEEEERDKVINMNNLIEGPTDTFLKKSIR